MRSMQVWVKKELVAVVVVLAVVGFVGVSSGRLRAAEPRLENGPETEVEAAVVQLPVIVGGINFAPTAADDSYQVEANLELVVDAAGGVLANDSTRPQSPLAARLESDVANGSLVLNPDGSFEYTPDPGFAGEDSFTYRAVSGLIASAPATVVITVVPSENPLVAVPDAYATVEDAPLVVDAAGGVLANDAPEASATGEAVLVSDVTTGALELRADGSFTYIPEADFSGLVSFVYRLVDGALESNTARVRLTVSPVNDAPRIVTGAVAFTKQIIGTDLDETHIVVAADFDKDGDMDAAATDYVDGMVFWFENDGQGGFISHVLDPDLEGAYPASVGDVDLDGDVDILAAGYLADTFVWYRNEGGGEFTRINIDTASDGAHSIVPVDMDQDGDNDLITSSQDANRIAWYENDGNQNFTLHIIDTNARDAKRAEVADLDGDGDLDVMAASFRSDEVAWHENDGNQNFTKHVITQSADGAYYVSAGDADGDGDLDVFAVSRVDGQVAWHRNDGAAGFTTQVMDMDASGARTILATDLDHDGDVDAVVTIVNNDKVVWYQNDGTGRFTKRIIDDELNGPYGASVVDMDFDGDLDVLVASKLSATATLHSQIRAHKATVESGGTLVINGPRLRTTDVDDGPAELTYTITQAPDHGELRLDGQPMAEGATVTQAAVDDGRLTYVHGGGPQTADSFAFTVADGGEDGVRPAAGTFVITINHTPVP